MHQHEPALHLEVGPVARQRLGRFQRIGFDGSSQWRRSRNRNAASTTKRPWRDLAYSAPHWTHLPTHAEVRRIGTRCEKCEQTKPRG